MSTNLNVYIIKIAVNGHPEDSVNNCYPDLNTIENLHDLILSCGKMVTGMIRKATKFGPVTAAFDSKLEFFSSCKPKPE